MVTVVLEMGTIMGTGGGDIGGADMMVGDVIMRDFPL